MAREQAGVPVPLTAHRSLLTFFNDRPALLPRELRDVVRPAAALPGRARALPPAEWLCAGPGAGGGAGALVRVAHAGLHLVEEPLHLGGVPREDAGREPVF